MGRERVFIVEDDEDIQELISYNLVRNSFTVKAFTKGEEFLEYLETDACDLAILDLMLPGMDGLEICKKLKKTPRTENIAVIMLTAKGEEVDRIVGLELGADDYITKPFSPRELILRVKAVLKRGYTEEKARLITAGPVHIDIVRNSATVDKKPLNLTATEFKLLAALAGSPGRVLSRDNLLDRIWGQDCYVTDRTVDTHIRRLREKLGKSAKYIETVRGFGYRFLEEE